MKYLVALLAVVCMCAMFMPIASGLSCYKCAWTDSTCTMNLDTSKVKSVPCAGSAAPGGANPAAPGGASPAAPGGASPAAPGGAATTKAAGSAVTTKAATTKPKVMRSQQLFSQLAESEKYYCFSILVKQNGTTTVERGCKADNKTDNCLIAADVKKSNPTAVLNECTVCQKDNCNANAGAYSLTGSALQYVVVSAILIGQIFLQAK